MRLSDFIVGTREEIVSRCRARVAARTELRPSAVELEHGIPLFLDQITLTLRSKTVPSSATIAETAREHGGNMLRSGFTVAQVVNDYTDVCQVLVALAIEHDAEISTADFSTLNLCLDEAIAGAVTEYSRQRETRVVADDLAKLTKQLNEQATQDLGFLAHELRNLLGTAMLAFEALKSGAVAVSGSTGAVLERSLVGLTTLVDRSLAVVRLSAGAVSRQRIGIAQLIEEVEIPAMLDARARGHVLNVETTAGGAVVDVDAQILSSILINLLQNAFKYTHPRSQVFLRTSATADRVRIEVEDQCGGLPAGKVDTLFTPFDQYSADRSGLGLGLSICLRGVEVLGGTIQVRDLPGTGCLFAVELPRVRFADLGSGTASRVAV